MAIQITHRIAVDESELQFSYIRSSGPGGQNVNKLSTAVQMWFDIRHSPSLPAMVRERMEHLGGKRVTNDGVLVITAQRFRSQDMNQQDAIARLVDLVREAAILPIIRRPTKPTRSSQNKRLESKAKHSSTKSLRGRVDY